MLAVLDTQCISLICFMTPAVEDFNYNASRPFLAPLLKCWDTRWTGARWWAAADPARREGGTVTTSDHTMGHCASPVAGFPHHLLWLGKARVQGEVEGGQGCCPWKLSLSLAITTIRCRRSFSKDPWLPPQHPPPSTSSCLPCAPFSRLAFNYFEWYIVN